MKTIEYYVNLPYRLELIPDLDEGGFVAEYPELPGCLSCGETEAQAVENAKDAKIEWITTAIEQGILIPEPEEYTEQLQLTIPERLKKELEERSRTEGISVNQYCLNLLSATILN